MGVSGYPVVVSGYLVAFSDYPEDLRHGCRQDIRNLQDTGKTAIPDITKAQKRPRGESARS